MLGAGILLKNFIFVVEPGEGCLIQNNISGLKEETYFEGMHWKVPVRDNIKRFNIRTRPILVSASTGTKDLQSTNLTMRVLFHPDENKLSTILLNLGYDYDERLLP
jgi:hypothetical protein